MKSGDHHSVAEHLRVAIIGCGLIGRKRFEALVPKQVKVLCDTNVNLAQALSGRAPGATVIADASEAVERNDVDVVVIATPNSALFPVAKLALKAGKHLLIEKPCGLSTAEIDELQQLAKQHRCQVRAGFNHRYHPALLKAHELFRAGALGELMFIRGRYGHGGRLGYEKEWRADPRLSGGGELMDQGVHLIDLAHWFMGPFEEIHGWAETFFWKMPVDDNAFLHLKGQNGTTAWLHVSCTEWKNLFSLEIYGKKAKLHVEGLGGSYGVERLSFYRMLPEMGPPDTEIYEYPRGDSSWRLELEELWRDIQQERRPVPGLIEAREALRVVETVYAQSSLNYSGNG